MDDYYDNLSIIIPIRHTEATLKRSILSRDGHLPVEVFTWGNPSDHAVVFINGLTNSEDSITPLGNRIGKDHFFVSWNSRGFPGTAGEENTDLGPEGHADDVVTVVEGLGLKSVDLIGVCTGAMVAFIASERIPAVVNSIVSLQGHFPSLDRETKMFEGLNQTHREILKDKRFATVACSALTGRRTDRINTSAPQFPSYIDETGFNSGLASNNNTPDSTYTPKAFEKWAHMWVLFSEYDMAPVLKRSTVDSYFFGGTDESFAFSYYGQSVEASKLVKKASLKLDRSLTHTSHYYDKSLMDDITRIVAQEVPLPQL